MGWALTCFADRAHWPGRATAVEGSMTDTFSASAALLVQAAWLRLVEHLDRIEEPARLVGWLVTTTRRECLRVLRRAGRERLVAADDGGALDVVDEGAEPLDATLITD